MNLKNPPVEGSAPAGEMCTLHFYPLTKVQVPPGPQCGAPVSPRGPQECPRGRGGLPRSSPGHPSRECCGRCVSPCSALKRAVVYKTRIVLVFHYQDSNSKTRLFRSCELENKRGHYLVKLLASPQHLLTPALIGLRWVSVPSEIPTKGYSTGTPRRTISAVCLSIS